MGWEDFDIAIRKTEGWDSGHGNRKDGRLAAWKEGRKERKRHSDEMTWWDMISWNGWIGIADTMNGTGTMSEASAEMSIR